MSYKNKEKQKEAQRRYYLENKKKIISSQTSKRSIYRRYIQDIKSKTPCIDCDIAYPHYIMDFDHMGDKKFNISHLGDASSFSALKKEILKCELVCSNCHRHRTFMRKCK